MSKQTDKGRHPILFMVKLLVFAGLISLAVKAISAKKKEFFGLTESQARQKFTEKLGPKMGEQKAAEVADQIIPKLKERGIVVEDPEFADADAGDESEAAQDEEPPAEE